MLPTKEVISLAGLVFKNFKSCESLLYICLIICIFYKGAAASKIYLYHNSAIITIYTFLTLNKASAEAHQRQS